MKIIVKKGNEVILNHDIYSISSANGYTHAFLTGGFIAINLQVNEFIEFQVLDDNSINIMHMLATFESYQFSMNTYVSNGNDGTSEGSTQNGITNNSLVFKNLQVLEN